ncbi:alpha/beta hydrolase [Polynucleobacter sp. AP-Melu-500A-A1]|uniref:alpha/beta hydrolase n=1 Tax=Polynucleobacter sp. AP-Melu-500A-A1 TaxID=2576929 RepID=UPI001C0C44DB|nr:alpha/beta hydrolase [Polynucleobacter sp. AP-Melu-500A-A1]MBU3631118.1 alpha/beta hydrolase [Polynucleobacter sp. AP-Melu-500A-A1]
MVSKLLLTLTCWALSTYSIAQVFDIPHQEEAPTRTLLIETVKPRALVLLFPGGGGMAGIFDNGSIKSKHTFIRSMDMWAQYGIDAVLVDTPYDLGDQKRGNLRSRKDHLTRVDEVVNFYKAKLKLPIWIFGHSMGSSTATYYANEIDQTKKNLTGIIIAGTIRTASLDDDVTLPVLAIHHQNDACSGTPVNASARIIDSRSLKLVSKLELIEGGISEGDVCQSFAYHGFNETEAEFVKRAANFILSH